MKQVNRRKFLQQSATLAAATSLPLGAFAQHAMPVGDIVKRYIPGTHEALPVVGLGAPAIFTNYPEEGGKELSHSVLKTFMDAGGRLCDTNPFFRPNDPVFGEIMTEMGNLQDDLFLTAKITVPGKEAGIAHLNRSLNALRKDPIDLAMVHNMNDMSNNWGTMKDFKAEGRARYIGVSLTRNTDYTALTDFMKAETPDVVMTGFSITQQGPAEQDVMAIAQDLGIAVIAVEPFKALDDGAFFSMVSGVEIPEFAKEIGIESWAQYSLKWILGEPAMTAVVMETSTPRHVVDNLTAAYGEFPDQATRKKMSDFLLDLA